MTETEAPVIIPVKPSTAPRPDRNPGEEPQTRPSPRPGHVPRPSTDPKQFADQLFLRYHGQIPTWLKPFARECRPFTSQSQLDLLEADADREQEEVMRVITAYPEILPPSELVQDILNRQAGQKDLILLLVRDFIQTRFGEMASRVLPYLEMTLAPHKATAVEHILKLADEDAGEFINLESKSIEDREYLIDTIKRAEIHSLLAQGFATVHMQDFIVFAGPQLDLVSPGLCSAYNAFYHLSRMGHFQALQAQLTLPEMTPFNADNSLGESDISYEPEISLDNPDEITGMLAYGRAVSPVGVVLAHEALKAAFQLLAVWSKVRENYLEPDEWNVMRLLINTPYAEARQFAIGPAFYRRFERGVEMRNGNPVINGEFFERVDGWFGNDQQPWCGILENILTGTSFREVKSK